MQIIWVNPKQKKEASDKKKKKKKKMWMITLNKIKQKKLIINIVYCLQDLINSKKP